MNKSISRRKFFKLAGGTAVTVTGASLLPQFLRKTLLAEKVVVGAADLPPDLFFAGTDGWFSLPTGPVGSALRSAFHPDPLAPSPFTTYIFGFRNVTGMTDTQRQNQRFKAQHNAPFFWVDQDTEFRLQLTNLGLQLRPDLTDAHTLHWHGFRNVIPFYDGEPSGSISVTVNQLFTYVYRPYDPGTYMYHCHVEDVEHVTMGMTGIVFVRAKQNKTGVGGGATAPIARLGGNASSPVMGYAYNDGVALSSPLSTAYNREYALFLSEVWLESHWNDAHIQENLWYNFKADFSLINGRVYPETLLPNSPVDLAKSSVANLGKALTIQTDANGDMKTKAGQEHLQYNPHSALVSCNENERVLLRFANLGFREASMTLAGITMRVIGRDATPMKGRDGSDTSYETNTILMGAGESYDVIFTAPAFSGGSGSSGQGYDTYVLYNRRYTQNDDTTNGSQGQRTEVHVYPGTTLPAQAYVNQHPNDTAA